MHPFCFFNFYRRKSAKFGVRLKEYDVLLLNLQAVLWYTGRKT